MTVRRVIVYLLGKTSRTKDSVVTFTRASQLPSHLCIPLAPKAENPLPCTSTSSGVLLSSASQDTNLLPMIKRILKIQIFLLCFILNMLTTMLYSPEPRSRKTCFCLTLSIWLILMTSVGLLSCLTFTRSLKHFVR